MHFSIFIVLVLAAFFTSAISAVVGMGGGVVLISILTLFLSPAVAIPVHAIVQLASNSTRTIKLRKHMVKGIVYPSLVGLCVGTYIAKQIISSVENKEVFLFCIAGIIFYTLFKPKKLPPIKIPYWAFGILSTVTGILGPLVGATGPLTAPFYLRDDLTKEQIIATKATVQTVGHLMKIILFLNLGFDFLAHWPLIAFMVVGVILGTHYGVKILKKIDEKRFRLIFRSALFIAACRVTYKAIASIL